VSGSGHPTFTRSGTGGSNRLGADASGPVLFNNAAPSNGLQWQNTALTASGTTGMASISGSADLTGAMGTTINTLRQAFMMQRMFERDARGGTRYPEWLRSQYGVTSPDARLQRPEYLGGSSSPVVINPVTQNSATSQISPQGNLAAYGLVNQRTHGFTKAFVEHGFVIGLMNVRAELTYQQGIHRMWSRQIREEIYLPVFANLGERGILNKEIYAQGTDADNEVFGFGPSWDEYRYAPSKITGKFRSTDPQTLDWWHLSQKFNNLPTLSAEFFAEHPPLQRVVAIKTEPQFKFDSRIEVRSARPMPVHSVPGGKTGL
jgi:hypothetical protein